MTINDAVFKLTLKRERLLEGTTGDMGKFPSSEDLVPLIRKLTKDEPQEVCLAFYFVGAGTLIGYSELARGGFDWVKWDQRMLFSTALLCGATSIIMAHNHPSGNARPSRTDVASMKKLIPAGGLLSIYIADHIVVSENQFVSMREFGLLPPAGLLSKEAEKEREKELDTVALKAAEGGGRGW